MTEARIQEILAQLTPRIVGQELAKGACGCSGCTTGPATAVSVHAPDDRREAKRWWTWEVRMKSGNPAYALLPFSHSVGLSYFIPADELTAIFAQTTDSVAAATDGGSQPSA